MESAAFLDLVERSRLIPSDRWTTFLSTHQASGDAPDSDHQWASLLVKENLLTSFQAKQILKGKWKHFIISDKYKVLDQLDSGSNATVFRCEHLTLRRQVALKMVAGLKKDKVRADLFLKDARAAGVLNHPNILRVYDIDQFHGEYFLVQELVEGINLGKWVRKQGPLEVGQAVYYMAQAAQGLQYASELGWVHKCLTPRQFLVDRQGILKILDYGLGSLRLSDAVSTTTTQFPEKGDATRLLDYLAPEQFATEAAIDIRTDIYALGCTFYFLLTARPPFAKYALHLKAMAHQSKQPPSLRELNSHVPAGLDAMILKMLAKEPKDRFQTPGEMLPLLSPYLPIQPQILETPPAEPEAAADSSATRSAIGDSLLQQQSIFKEVMQQDAEVGPFSGYHVSYPIHHPPAGSRRWKTWLVMILLAAAAGGLAYGYFNFIRDKPFSEQWQTAQSLAEQQQWDQAVRAYDAVIERSRRIRGQDPQAIFTAIAAHEPLLKGLVEQRPKDLDLQLFAAAHYQKRKQWPMARVCFHNAHAAKPDAFKAWSEWAFCSLMSDDWKELGAALVQAADAKPDDPAIALQTSLVLQRGGQMEAWQKFLGIMWDRSQSSKQSQVWLAHLAFAWAFAPNPVEPLPANREKLQQALEPMKHVSWIRFARLACLYRIDQAEGSIQRFQEARDTDFSWPSASLYTGFLTLAYHQRQQHEPMLRARREWNGWYQRTMQEIASTGQWPAAMPWWEMVAIQLLQAEIEKSMGPIKEDSP